MLKLSPEDFFVKELTTDYAVILDLNKSRCTCGLQLPTINTKEIINFDINCI
jgi:hypothetical protein